MAQEPPRKRPWYLVAGLLGALAFGVNGSFEGWSIWVTYHSERPDPSDLLTLFHTDSGRDMVAAAFDRLLAVQDTAMPRVYPFGVALLVIGVAMMFFALRAMSGRGSARGTLVQLVLVHAAICIGGFFVTRDLREADVAFKNAQIVASAQDQPQTAETDSAVRLLVRVTPFFPALGLVARSIASALIVLALTRPRSREFFEATRDPATEP